MERLKNRVRGATAIRSKCVLRVAAALALTLAHAAFAQAKGGQTVKPGPTIQKPGDQSATGSKEFFIHAFHAEKLGGLECSLCHTPVKEGSVELRRPGHDQCKACHADD